MEKIKLESVHFEKLKGLRNATVKFEKPLTAIMGVNGAGKTTVIHALACLFQPDGGDENYKFPYFFTPTTDSTWKDSKLTAYWSDGEGNSSSKTYEKAFDRWSPRYDRRPKRNVYYIGIDSCLPEIEQINNLSSIKYTSEECADKISKKVIEYAAYIMNKDYTTLIDNNYKGKSMLGVRTKRGLKYSSLSMGSGEQRTIRILRKVCEAEAYSLILIDEIDLLMHVSALRRLIKVLFDIASKKNMQVVFTTHAVEMCELNECVGIQYINTIKNNSEEEKTLVYDKITIDFIYNLTGHAIQPIKIYVEDEYAKGLIKSLINEMGISEKVAIIKYGAITNGFTLAAGMLLSGENTENCLIVLDGDSFRTEEEKIKQIKSVLSGTECNIEDKREKAMSLITQFNLPDDVSPEKFAHNCLCESGDMNNEIVRVAQDIHAVSDSHEWIYEIRVRLNETEEYIARRVADIVCKTKQWDVYISSIKEWLEKRKNI